jgi:ATP-binding cassette subfamily F protein 3
VSSSREYTSCFINDFHFLTFFYFYTNPLDLETTEALIKALKEFKGGVVLVSHDQHLLTNVIKDLYVVENGVLEKLRQGTTNGEAFNRYKKDVVQGRR